MYAVLLVTGGQFTWVWLVMLMRDINDMERRSVFPATSLAIASFIGLLIYFSLIFFPPMPGTLPQGMSSTRLALMFILGVGLLLFQIVLLVQIHRHIKIALESTFNVMDAIFTAALTLLMFLSFVHVQKSLNVVIEGRASPGG
jgi:hypothetical protein